MTDGPADTWPENRVKDKVLGRDDALILVTRNDNPGDECSCLLYAMRSREIV